MSERPTRSVTIPACRSHEGHLSLSVTLFWDCPVCGGPRGVPRRAFSYDGSRQLECDSWENPCGHIDSYESVRHEAAENGLNHAVCPKGAADGLALVWSGDDWTITATSRWLSLRSAGIPCIRLASGGFAAAARFFAGDGSVLETAGRSFELFPCEYTSSTVLTDGTFRAEIPMATAADLADWLAVMALPAPPLCTELLGGNIRLVVAAGRPARLICSESVPLGPAVIGLEGDSCLRLQDQLAGAAARHDHELVGTYGDARLSLTHCTDGRIDLAARSPHGIATLTVPRARLALLAMALRHLGPQAPDLRGGTFP